MKNFQPGGLRNRRDDIGGRPRGDVNAYAPKHRQATGKPAFGKSRDTERRGSFNSHDRAPRPQKSYEATCSTCGRQCDVPFRPDGVKPVLCRDCFAKKNASPTNMSADRGRFTNNELRGHATAPTASAPSVPSGISAAEYQLLVKQINVLEEKVTQILSLVQATEVVLQNLPTLSVDMSAISTAVKPVKKASTKKEPATVKKKAPTKKVAVAKAPAKVIKKVAAKKPAKKK